MARPQRCAGFGRLWRRPLRPAHRVRKPAAAGGETQPDREPSRSRRPGHAWSECTGPFRFSQGRRGRQARRSMALVVPASAESAIPRISGGSPGPSACCNQIQIGVRQLLGSNPPQAAQADERSGRECSRRGGNSKLFCHDTHVVGRDPLCQLEKISVAGVFDGLGDANPSVAGRIPATVD